MDPFEELDIKIGNCKLCYEFSPLEKNPRLKRGKKSKIMVIGLSPGQRETEMGLAFSGQAGKKLFEWLKTAEIGLNEEIIRDTIYLTSLIKCQKKDINDISLMFINCQDYLKEQIKIVSPKIIITLGISVFNILFNKNLETKDIVGKIFTFNEINETPMFPEMSIVYGLDYIIPLPHPSGLNRWLNDSGNKKHLETALDLLKKYNNEK